jgi:hypothetical protein
MKIKHYTFFSDSHKIFLKYFLNTFPFDEDIDLQIRYMPQECASGEFVSDGWQKTMTKKVKYIVDALHEMKDGDVFIHSDSDIVFLKSYKKILLEEMGNADLIFQSDVGTACMGFFACRVHKKTKDFFKKVYDDLDQYYHDQEAVNALMKNYKHDLNIKLFSYRFFNHGFFGKHYEGENDILLPDDIIVFHANFVYGVEKKIKLIKIVNEKIKKQ